MSTNNFSEIESLLDFSIDDNFYYIQLLRRKKDNPNAKSVKVIKNFYVDNLKYFRRKKETIIDLCNFFNARAYIRLNRRSYKDVAYNLNIEIGKALKSKQYKHVSRLFSKACGRCNVEPNRIWIIDIDEEDYDHEVGAFEQTVELVKTRIQQLQLEIKQRDYQLINDISTPNGLHILTNPFNVKKFKETFPDIDIHKDNPTIMYTP